MIEILQYKNVPYSSYGFQWTPIAEFPDLQTAEEEIERLIRVDGVKREDLKTRTKVVREGKSYGGFRMKEKPIHFDLSASERKRRWDSSDPNEKI